MPYRFRRFRVYLIVLNSVELRTFEPRVNSLELVTHSFPNSNNFKIKRTQIEPKSVFIIPFELETEND